MLGKKPSIFWRLCWKYVSPTFLFVILIFTLLGYEDMLGPEYEYPEWSTTVGWMLTLSSVLCIPGYMIVKFLCSSGGFKHRLRQVFKPDIEITSPVPNQYPIDGSTAVWQVHSFSNSLQLMDSSHYLSHSNSSSSVVVNSTNHNNNYNKALRHVTFSPTTCLCSSSTINSFTATTGVGDKSSLAYNGFKSYYYPYHRSNCGKSDRVNDLRCKCIYYCKNNNSYDKPRCLSFATEWLV